ncbi:conserved hypothetical protein [Verrucomicrobia bacterium]|nr:conserved hypothetical protein [Verrucomicrobiota bacterium]
MLYRVIFLAITVFWLAMNVLLWRAEYGPQARIGSAVPAQVVWQKVLTAPDSSSLTIFVHRKKVGFCHWITSVGEDSSRLKAGEDSPEGMVEQVAGYSIQLEGNLVVKDFASRARFDASLKLGTNELWQELNVRLSLRPTTIELRSVAAQQKLRLRVEDGTDQFERVFSFSELQNPRALLTERGGPSVAALLSQLGADPGPTEANPWQNGLKWEARTDTLKIGLAPVRAYRLQAPLFDRYRVLIFVSRVGEILRVELPNDIVLVNDQVAGL